MGGDELRNVEDMKFLELSPSPNLLGSFSGWTTSAKPRQFLLLLAKMATSGISDEVSDCFFSPPYTVLR